ncbi:hypothetical protein FGRMN_3710 [Fusarium graminum]|nr:hypothetical protein FGRMN_3710 [Fusarium graminum]
MVAAVLRHSPIVAVGMANSTTTTPSTNISVGTGVDNGADTSTGATVPELSDLDYFIAVLHLPNGRTENQIEDDLVSRANALGISSAPVTDKRITSSVESASTVYNARTFSMLSGDSASTALTTHSSLFGSPTPDLALSSGRQSKDFSFVQYDRYLSVIDPHHNHPKTTRESLPPNKSTPSIFSGKTKRSLFSVKSSFKLRWKKKSPQPLQVIFTRVCLMCKHNAHPTGKDCPEDWELDQVIKTGDKAGWKRCYKCHNLVPLEEGSTRMICRCKAQFCYTCGGVWDANTGCPNYCDGEEEIERRKREEHAQLIQYEEEKAAQEAAAAAASTERLEAEERTRNRIHFSNLAEAQQEEQRRFLQFFQQCKEHMKIRFAEQRKEMTKQHTEEEEMMKGKHVKTISQLEDRQVAAEMDLRNTLEASARSVKIRLKHMEAYCDGLGRSSKDSRPGSDSPQQRVVTERDLRELGQQYNIRDGMERSHQAKINVMRDRQAKRMEELIDRQEMEFETFLGQNRDELDELTAQEMQEENALGTKFSARKTKLVRRWELAIEILRKELEAQDGVKYAPTPTPTWPGATTQVLFPK